MKKREREESRAWNLSWFCRRDVLLWTQSQSYPFCRLIMGFHRRYVSQLTNVLMDGWTRAKSQERNKKRKKDAWSSRIVITCVTILPTLSSSHSSFSHSTYNLYIYRYTHASQIEIGGQDTCLVYYVYIPIYVHRGHGCW